MTNAVSQQNSVNLGFSLSMRSFAIDEPRSSDRALYATQDLGAIEILLFENYFDTFDCLSREVGIDLPYVFVDNTQKKISLRRHYHHRQL